MSLHCLYTEGCHLSLNCSDHNELSFQSEFFLWVASLTDFLYYLSLALVQYFILKACAFSAKSIQQIKGIGIADGFPACQKKGVM